MQDLVLLKEMVHAPKKNRGGGARYSASLFGASRDCTATLFAFPEAAEAASWLRDVLDCQRQAARYYRRALLAALHLLLVARPWRAICR
jgi:hypothetical protein